MQEPRIVRPGRNAWDVAPADHVSFLVDAEAYFRQLEKVLKRATRSVWMLGWDFDPRIDLRKGRSGGERLLGLFLRELVEKCPTLEIRILIWAEGPVYSSGVLPLFRNSEWQDHPRIMVRYDASHPLRGSHHQKIVCVDDAIAFVGGMDLTSRRWDDRHHRADARTRIDPDGKTYEPVHDVQAMVSGPVVGSLARVVHDRWRAGAGGDVPEIDPQPLPWPAKLEPDIRDCAVAISLADPGTGGRTRHRETIRLACDAVDEARRHIYIETQYLASAPLTRRLAARLKQAEGPEVVILVTRHMRGIFEQATMGFGRDRAIRRLRRADAHNRLRIAYPVVPDGAGGECEIMIHSKVMVVDDGFVRVGSSNLNNRSAGFDTECDLAIEARTASEREGIRRFRDGLLAEHLDVTPDALSEIVTETGSLVAAFDRLNIRPRGLRPFKVDMNKRSTFWRYGSGIMDPKKPYWPLQRLRQPFRRLGAFLTRFFR